MSNDAHGNWLSDQFKASAQHLASLHPSLLSPTGRSLQADITALFEHCTHATQLENRQLRVVRQNANPDRAAPSQQLPLITPLSSQ